MSQTYNIPTDSLSIDVGDDYPDIRESVRRLCADFPGLYWRKLEEAQAYSKGLGSQILPPLL